MEMKKLEWENDQFYEPRASTCIIPFPPLFCMDSLSRRSLSYDKLPPEPLRLTVLKLDGSCFEITVAKTGTVGELKRAVEAAFSHLPKKGPRKVSWPHVWSQFCLSYDGHKLLCDSDTIGIYRIKDGDQLHFVHHTSYNCNLSRMRLEKEDPDSDDEPSVSKRYMDRQHNIENNYSHCIEILENEQDDDVESDAVVSTHSEYMLNQSSKGLFQSRRLSGSKMRMEEVSTSSRPSCINVLASFRNILRLYSHKDDLRLKDT